MSMPRTVGVVRLSRHSGRADDPSTSPERQRKLIEGDTSLNIIGWAEDLGVSAAKVPPWERPELGEWLRRPDDWDTLAFWKLDRLVRSVGDFSEIIKWSQGKANNTGLPKVDRPKNLVSIADKIDLSTPHGRAMANMVAVFAELEAEIIKERVNDARKELYETGRWPGGRYPFGYVPIKQPDGGWKLEKDPVTAPVVVELVERVLAGEPAYAVQLDFQSRGIPTPKGGKNGWDQVNVSKILRSRALLGEATFKAITADGGLPIDPLRAEPLITFQQWDQLQKKFEGNGKRERVTGASLLLDIAFCALCGFPMYQRNMRPKNKAGEHRKPYRYFGCGGRWSRRNKDCEAKSAVRADILEPLVESTLLETIGHLDIVRTVRVPGESHAAEIAECAAALEDLIARTEGKGPAALKVYEKRIAALEGKLERLSALPERPSSTRQESTGQTYSAAWESSDDAGKRRLLKDSGVRVEVVKAGSGGSVSMGLFERPEGIPHPTPGQGVIYVAAAVTVVDGIQVALFLPANLAERATGNPDVRLAFRQRSLFPGIPDKTL